ncbi:hypothetical protein K7432_006769 [Basidiobolus ranarum]|uniref:Uncharacterized protein n=1 Tax=Basidiobolus ranarum TaxID=34480 RepID=A0ABR2WUL3_9FUNG
MARLLIFTLACIAASSVHCIPSASPGNPYTPENYPGLIVNEGRMNAICHHGDITFLAETSSECPMDVGCYALDRDRRYIERDLADLKKNGNEVWPQSSEGGFPHRVNPKYTNLKDWPNKGKLFLLNANIRCLLSKIVQLHKHMPSIYKMLELYVQVIMTCFSITFFIYLVSRSHRVYSLIHVHRISAVVG